MHISSSELQEKINKGDKIIVVLWAEWCGGCRKQKPIFEQVSKKAIEENSEVSYYMFNVDLDRPFSFSLGIRTIPTIKSFANGEEVTTKVGLMDELELKSLENTLINGELQQSKL
jgi:thiol-disulfide isomerase/thioredoxin